MYLVFVFLAGMPGESFRRRFKVFVVVIQLRGFMSNGELCSELDK